MMKKINVFNSISKSLKNNITMSKCILQMKLSLLILVYTLIVLMEQAVTQKVQSNEFVDFTIENNIVNGKKISSPNFDLNFGAFLLNKMKKSPDHVIMIDANNGRNITYREMIDRSIRCAIWLKKQNVNAEDIVAMSEYNHIDAYIPTLASFYLTAVINPWIAHIPLITARSFMKLTQPKVMFTMAKSADTYKEAAKLENLEVKIITFDGHENYETLDKILNDQTLGEIRNFEPVQMKSIKDPAYLAFSSGTTGFPKGVLHSFEFLYLSFYNEFDKGRVSLTYVPLGSIEGMINFLKVFGETGTDAIHAKFDVNETLDVINKYKVDFMELSLSMVTTLVKSGVLKTDKRFCLASMKRAFTGEEKANKYILEEFRKDVPWFFLENRYGMTEAGTLFLMQTKNSKIIDSIGFVVPNAEVKIVDENGNTLGPNEPGELCVRKPGMMLGYYKNPKATTEIIDKDGWLHSGDKVMYNENGEFIFVERLKLLLKYKDRHVSPTEIEAHLIRHPGIKKVIVVGVHEDGVGDLPMAFVEKTPESQIAEDDVVKMSAELGEMKTLWGGVVFLDEMPVTASGKVARNDLKELAKKIHGKNSLTAT